MARNKKSIAAEEDWIIGLTLKEISEKHNVAIEAVRTWYKSYDWAKKRKKFNTRRTSTTFDRLLKESEAYSKDCLKKGKKLSKVFDCLIDHLEKKARGENPPPLPEGLVNDLSDYAAILRKLSGLHRDVIPDFNDQLANRMIDEQKKKNEDESNGDENA